jgi:alpha-mannosidase
VDWHEHHRFLKVGFPVDVRSSTATYEVQHGHLERPTVRNTSWDVARFEVSAHRWADLSEPGYGVALLNDGKYGYDIHRNVMRLSLLRAPGWPDPRADRGHHRFAYALLPHIGDLRDAGVIAQAEAFNLPVDVRTGTPTSGTIVAVDRPNVSVEAVKKADREDAIVVRLCEVWGARGPVRITIGAPVTSATKTDLLERDTGEIPVDDGAIEITMRPFELVTLKVRM